MLELFRSLRARPDDAITRPKKVAADAYLAMVRALLPGLALASVVALVAHFLVGLGQGLFPYAVIEPLVAALLVGVLIRNVVRLPAATRVGSSFAAKQLLEFAVVLLGATINLQAVLRAGPALLSAVALLVVGGLTAGYTIGRVVGLPPRLAVLVAVGNAICGNSAIAAVAPVIRAEKRDIASAVALTAILGVALVLTLPILIPFLSLSHYQYGVLAGLTVYAVPQVVAASFPISQLSGQTAVLVKLIRVLFIGPVVVLFSLLYARTQVTRASWHHSVRVPWFVSGFVALMLLGSLGVLPGSATNAFREVSRVLTVIAMAALGLGVEFASIKTVGLAAGSAVLGSLMVLVLLALGIIFGFGL